MKIYPPSQMRYRPFSILIHPPLVARNVEITSVSFVGLARSCGQPRARISLIGLSVLGRKVPTWRFPLCLGMMNRSPEANIQVSKATNSSYLATVLLCSELSVGENPSTPEKC